MKIKRIAHIGVGVKDTDKAKPCFRKCFLCRFPTKNCWVN